MNSIKVENWTVLSLLTWTTAYFTKYKIQTPRLDAEVLLSHQLSVDRVGLYMQFERILTQDELSSFKQIIKRRIAGEPVSYIRGIKEFWSLSFRVGPGVMVPRPDTEVLVERVKGGSWIVNREQQCHILDIGTGSGNLAVALAREFPQAKVIALDVSEEALYYAKQNAETNKVSHQIEFLKQDFLTIHHPPSTIHYDLIVSNPPYIPTSTVDTLDKGIKDYEPRIALDGGNDGLDFYRKIGESMTTLLREGGIVAVEIGEDQGCSVKKIFEDVGIKDIKVIKDYAGLDRVVIGSRYDDGFIP